MTSLSNFGINVCRQQPERKGGVRAGTRGLPRPAERMTEAGFARHHCRYFSSTITNITKLNSMSCLVQQPKNIDNEPEKTTVFQVPELFSHGFPIFEEIRRQGKLCDVTLKVCGIAFVNLHPTGKLEIIFVIRSFLIRSIL